MEKVEGAKAPAALFVKELERLLGSAQFFGGANVSSRGSARPAGGHLPGGHSRG